MAKDGKPRGAGKKNALEPVAREYTINLHKRLHGIKFKGRAPRAIKEIKAFATKVMKTKDVRLDAGLNKAVWAKGVRNVPFRLRVVVERRRNDDEDAKDPVYSYVTVAADQQTKGKTTVKIDTA
jgi:large subunit ribosomal protein L31e